MMDVKQLKKSFPPLVDNETRILILGTLPGDESLRLQQYYANPRNQFWKILSVIWNEPVPELYGDKVKWLLRHRVGLWDVCHSASRKGSLDQHIEAEVPNNLSSLLNEFSDIKTILFNGTRARDTYERYFSKHPAIKYGTLISSSGAAAMTLEKKANQWKDYIIMIKEVGDD